VLQRVPVSQRVQGLLPKLRHPTGAPGRICAPGCIHALLCLVHFLKQRVSSNGI